MTNNTSDLIELLRQRARRQPLQNAYTFLTDGEAEEITLTYEQTDRRARAIAARLQSLDARGTRVLLLYPPGIEYISAFWGCLYAGAVAVPAYPPRQNRSLLRLQAVVADAQSTLALTTSSLLAKVDALTTQSPGLKNLRWLATETVADEAAAEWRRPAVDSDSLAFLQYTSGSTSVPKGVMVTHGNLLHNERMIQEAFQQTEQSIIVGWLPLYHDMGLIGNVLQPIYVGAQCVLMSPVAFLQNPFRWLSAISRHRATTSGGPNFAYDLCVRKIDAEQRELLDLSSWEVAFNGAEPVRAATMTAFAEAFAPCGFSRQAFRPCYGLAEATLMVSSEARTPDSPRVRTVETEALQNNLVAEAAPDRAGVRTLVSCGKSPSGQRVYIYHPGTFTECLPGEVGEICVAGPNVTKGYWNRPDDTARTFQSHRRDGHTEPLLRTGDLGVLLDGDLFVTGRLKDLIIIRGRNHYPHDIERTVEQSHPALRPGSGAAFVVEVDGEERLVVAQEVSVRRQLNGDEIIRAISRAVVEEHEVQVHAVVLLRTGSIPKTSSGKIQRYACREKFLSGSFDAVVSWEASVSAESGGGERGGAPDARNRESIESWLRDEVAAKLGLAAAAVQINRPISDYALDSLAAIELTHLIEAKLGAVLPMASLLQSPSIAEIVAQVESAATTMPASPRPAPAGVDAAQHPLSRGQQALWFLYRLAPDNAAYNVASAVRIVSPLDVSALRRAFQALLDRHPSLRSTVVAHQGEPLQRILGHAEVSFEETDASEWSESSLKRRLVEEAERRFDLEHGPLLRVSLFRRAEHDHVVLLVTHHIVTDFWSLAVLTSELGALYTAEVAGIPAQLPPVPSRYADYVRRQEQMLAGPEGERLWSYWRKQLAGELPVLDLPTDRPRPPVQTYGGGSEAFKLDEEVTRRLKELGRARGATLYMTLLAAFQTLLYRYTGQQDILVGSPTSGRNREELAGLVGYFVNAVVIRSRPSGDDTFASFLEQTRQTVLAAFEHQDYPFPLLVERLQPEREASRSPLFQAMFILQKAHRLNEEDLTSFALGETGARVQLGALELESVALEQRISQFDITLVMVESGNTLSASLQYNTDLFEAATIARMAEHLKTLLHSIVTRPQERLSRQSVLTPARLRQITVDWNRTDAPFPSGLCLHHLFAAQAQRTPSSTALIFGHLHLSYSELDRRANRLARRLQTLGVGPEVFVALLLKRGPEMVVTLLAVLKAGGAYLPLEPTYPPERLRFMLEDTQAALLVTEEGLLPLADSLLSPVEPATADAPPAEYRRPAAPRADVRVVVLEGEAAAIAELPDTAPLSAVSPQNMAYIIYTSGSTGRPKGVVINHSSAVVMVQWAGTYFTREQLAGVLASTSVSFDLSVFELFAPLSVGGTVVLAENALQLPELPAASSVTLVNTVPSAMAELARRGGVPPSVETVNLAGEALTRELVEQLYELGTVKKVVNLYGPSEDTTYSTFAPIERGGEGSPTIGRPLAKTQAYVLDEYGEVVGEGVTGELYLGGEGVGRGYLGRPGLTGERFVPDRFGGRAGARLYRTGDVVRWREGGLLEYVGRTDHQIKVRGYRIELGEIEAVLRGHEKVREAVVTVSGEGSGEKSLVAYMVMEGGEARGSAGEWQQYVRGRLPEYMVPQGFVMLEELPLTANGKVDRRALAAAGHIRVEAAEAYAGPRTATEEVLTKIWAEVLRAERVGIDADFFHLGGHSLLATRMLSQVRKRFGVEVSLRSFFERATVGGLARQIDLALRAAQALNVPSIRPAPRKGNAPLSYAQRRLWFLNQLEPDDTAYNMPAASRLTGDLNKAALEQSLTEIIRRHEIMRTVFVMEEDEPKQVVRPAQPIRLPLVELSGLSASEREDEAMRLATAEAQQPFDLARGPLARFTLLRLSDEEHILLSTMHHIIFDGWSIGVLINELTALYRTYSDGRASPLAEPPVQYADYAAWQHEWLRGDALEPQLAYWGRQLADVTEALNLPTDKPRPAAPSINGAYQSFQLSATLAEALKTLARSERATLFMVLLAAFQVLLSRYTGQTDMTVGTVVSNRDRAEVEGLIGFFVNILVMRGDVSRNPSFSEYLRRVRESALEAYAHQDVPFETLVEALQVARSLNRTPLFQVAFTLQTAPTAELELAGVKLSRVEVDAGRAQFDISLSMAETENGEITGSFNYNTDLFYPATIERMQEHFRTLLEGVTTRPEARILELPLVTAAERRELLLTRNRTARPYPLDATLHSLFESQAARSPHRIALAASSSSLSYSQLNSRANRLARHLRARGVGPEQLVGVCLRRSPEMAVALLAVLKAGGAYLPLDPDYPSERLRFMLDDARPALVLTERPLPAGLPDGAPALCLEEAEAEAAGLASHDPAPAVTSDGLVYVIYTSGSTGRPKGAMLTHRGVVNCVNWMQETYGLGEDDRFLLKTSLSFDPSVWELFWPLSVGAQVVVAEAGREAEAEYLGECIRSQGVTSVYFVPSMLRAFVDEGGAGGCESLRRVICGGEALSVEGMAECLRAMPWAELHHSYGPTEASIAAAEWECEEGEAGRLGVVVMGRPMGNTQLYVLDGVGEPVPDGVSGELYIGGEGVGRGYLGRPGLTGERFVPDGFGGRAGARLYRTGDVVRWREGGLLEYVGRTDHQIKVRGYRIELGEIEAALRSHAAVREAVVDVVAGGGAEPRLVCYVVRRDGAAGAGGATSGVWAEMRAHLRERLPEYMVPQGFVMLEELPLTANGKVDRRALAASGEAQREEAQGGTEAGTETERAVEEIWKAVLGVGAVKMEDNFFDAGGHSLLATRMLSQVRKRFGVEVSLRSFFERATVGELARQIDLALRVNTKHTPPTILKASREHYRMNTSKQGTLTLPEALRKEVVQE